MPILVNGEIVPTELIRAEERGLAQLPEWQGAPDELEKSATTPSTSATVACDLISAIAASTRSWVRPFT